MLATMTGPQLGEWMEFFECEPFGGPHEDYRFAQVLGLLYDAHRDSESSARPLSHWFHSLKSQQASNWDTAEGQVLIGKLYGSAYRAPK